MNNTYKTKNNTYKISEIVTIILTRQSHAFTLQMHRNIGSNHILFASSNTFSKASVSIKSVISSLLQHNSQQSVTALAFQDEHTLITSGSVDG